MMCRFILLAALAVASIAHAADTPVTDAGALTVADFFRSSVFYSATLSPDGKYVLVVNHPDPEHQYVSLIDLKAETSTDIVTSVDKSEYFTDLQWVSSDTAVFYYHVGKQGYTKLVAAKLLGIKDGRPDVKITTWPGAWYWILARIPGAGSTVMLAEKEGSCICIHRVDINSDPDKLGADSTIYKLDPKEEWVMTDKEGRPVVIETVDDDHVRHFLRYSTNSGGHATWTEFKKLDDPKATFIPELLAPDGHDYYVFSNIGHDTVGYYEYDPDKDSFVRTLYSNDEGDVEDWRFDPLIYSLTYLKWYAGTDPRYEVLDERAKHFVPALQQAFPGQQVVPRDISADGNEVLVYVYSALNEGAYYAFDVGARRAELLGAQKPWLDPDIMAPVKAGNLKTQDGFTLNYLITLPKTGPKPYPLVVIPHGGPIGVFNFNGFDAETQLLASRGYAVLKVNYRGSGGSGKNFRQAGNRQWGRKIEDDIEEAVHTVLKTAPVDPDRVCIYGASYGGYSALMSLIRDPALYKCAASYAGVTDLPLLYNSTSVQFDKVVQDDMADIIGDPTTQAAELRSFSPVYLADKIRRPVLLAQGGHDTRVDVEQAYRLKLVMQALKRPVEFQFYPNEIHGFKYTDDETDFYLRLLDFLNRNIASTRPVAPPPAP
jgi:dipeptidyl aminopeptidase/acylaminoacyl peptidase